MKRWLIKNSEYLGLVIRPVLFYLERKEAVDLAYLKQAKTTEEIKKLTVNNVKKAYNELALDYNHILDLDYIYCPICGKWKSTSNFYQSKKTASGIEHFGCKACILDMCTDKLPDGGRVDNRDKTIETFRKLDWVFIENDYKAQLQAIEENVGEKVRSTAAQTYIVMISSLPQYRGLSFKDSVFDIDDLENNTAENVKVVQKTLKAAKKRFGNNYNNDSLMFLENEYEDWTSRYECETKAQEEVFESLAILKLAKRDALKAGKSTKEIDKSYQDWLDTGNLKPKQNTLDTLSDAQTLGTLIQKYEETRPLPEIDPELADVDKIGTYIDAFYRGHACKMLGLKNRFSHIYEKIMAKYAVSPPTYDEENDSEILFDKIFGNKEDM